MTTLDGAEEWKLVHEAFVDFIPARPEYRDNRAEGWVCNGYEGVQWNVGPRLVAARGKESLLGVNLEGLVYNGRRPIVALLQRELENPLVFEAIDRIGRPKDIEVHLAREAWKNPRKRASPNYSERVILEISLEKLNPQSWHNALKQAKACFDDRGEPRALPITFYDEYTGQRNAISTKQYPMKPHLWFGCVLWQHPPATKEARVEAVRHAQNQMQPLYEFVQQRSV